MVGADKITSLTEDTEEANIASRFYDESRKSILSEILWNFAAKRVLLTQVVVTPAWIKDGMNFIYQEPSDVIRIFGTNNDAASWRLEGELIYSTSNDLGIVYVFDLTDTTKFSASFTDAFADKLAADMVYDINNSTTSAGDLLEKYNSVSLPKATAENSQVGTPPQVSDGLWSNSRHGFSPIGNRGNVIA